MFQYYVMNERNNKIESFNIFQNWVLDEAVQKEVKKYLRSPSNYKYEKRHKEVLYGFDAFCEKLSHLIKWQEWSRCQYEIIVKSLFDKNGETERKIDCYEQCLPNIAMIAREVIWQWKQQKNV